MRTRGKNFRHRGNHTETPQRQIVVAEYNATADIRQASRRYSGETCHRRTSGMYYGNHGRRNG